MAVKCPYCAENIQKDAAKCRYCGEWLRPVAGINLTPVVGYGAKLQRLHWLLRGFITLWLLNWVFGIYFLHLTLNRDVAPFMYLSSIGAAAWACLARPPIGSFALSVGLWALIWWSFAVERNRYGHDYALGDLTALHFLVFTGATITLIVAWAIKLAGLRAKVAVGANASSTQTPPPVSQVPQQQARYKMCPRRGTSSALIDIHCSVCGRQYSTKFE